MWRPRIASVRLRICLIATLAVFVGLLVGGFTLLALHRQALLDAHAGTGPQRAAELAALAATGPLPSVLPPVTSDRVTLLQVIDASGKVEAASAGLEGMGPLLGPDERRRRVLDDVPGLGDGSWLAEPAQATLGGRRSTVIVLTSLRDSERSAELLRNSLLIVIPVLATGVGAVVWFVVGRALRPVEAMRTEVELITAQQLDRRVPTSMARDEVSRLASTLNDMLDRLQSSNDAQRRFVADASHELRTPITNARTSVEVALADPRDTDWTAVANDVLAQTARMERLTDDLLIMARASNGATPMRTAAVDIRELLLSQAGRAVPDERRLDVSTSITPTTVNGDEDQLGRMLTNLVDNALRHARQRVSVTASRGFDWVELRVVDDGPGVPVADREAVFKPFVRRDSHRGRTDGGSGLGLAIVKQIVTAHGGSVVIRDASPGAIFIVRLPLSESSQAPIDTVET